MNRSLVLATLLAITLSGCGIKQMVSNAWDSTTSAVSSAVSWVTGEPTKEEREEKRLKIQEGSIFDNTRNNYPVVEPNLQFYGVEDTYDIEEQLRAYKTKCKNRGDYATCNLLGKYYLQFGEKGRQEAYKWYSIGCNQHKNPYACGVKKYLEAGGY